MKNYLIALLCISSLGSTYGCSNFEIQISNPRMRLINAPDFATLAGKCAFATLPENNPSRRALLLALCAWRFYQQSNGQGMGCERILLENVFVMLSKDLFIKGPGKSGWCFFWELTKADLLGGFLATLLT